MKTTGLLGGMSWQSTQTYYRILNEGIREAMGGLHSAQCLLYSVDFEPIERMQQAGKWDEMGGALTAAAQALERGGADFLVLCTNTMHKIAPQIERGIGIPMLHICDTVGAALRADGIRRVALLGTKYTMEQAFYRERIEAAGIEVMVPTAEERAVINDVIFQELCLGVISEASRAAYVRVLERMRADGAEAGILGCTEIGLLVSQSDTDMPLYDTTEVHARAAVRMALS